MLFMPKETKQEHDRHLRQLRRQGPGTGAGSGSGAREARLVGVLGPVDSRRQDLVAGDRPGVEARALRGRALVADGGGVVLGVRRSR